MLKNDENYQILIETCQNYIHNFSAKIQKYPRNEGRIQKQKIYVFDFHTENIKIAPVLLARKFKNIRKIREKIYPEP